MQVKKIAALGPNGKLMASTAIFCVLSYFWGDIYTASKLSQVGQLAMVAGTLLLGPTMFVFSLSSSLETTFRTTQDVVRALATAYACIIFLFAAAYFQLSSIYDHNDAIAEYYHGWGEPNKPWERREKAFNGISERLWSANVDRAKAAQDEGTRKELSQIGIPPTPARIEVRHNADAKMDVAIDCLYFSIVTIATLGYGDITPADKLTKLLVAIEVIIGQIIVVVGWALAITRSTNRNR